jgi:hypothetical protein
MKYEVYDGIKVAADFAVFDFISTGRNGTIQKRIAFTETDWKNVYNLAFGDIDDDGSINDSSVSNNGDRNKILATVARVVDDYTKRYPDRWIIFKGSTDERTRLYRMAVGLHLEELSATFEIYGYVDEQFILFNKELKISAFLIKRKSI